MIWLANKTLDDLVKIPLDIKDKRIEVRPNIDNEVYTLNRLLIHYRLVSEGMKDYPGSSSIIDSLGTVEPVFHSFKDIKGKLNSLDFWLLEIWDQIPKGFRDVVLFHEVKELEYFVQNLEWSKSHNLSVEETKAYIQKYLSNGEKIIYKELIESMKER